MTPLVVYLIGILVVGVEAREAVLATAEGTLGDWIIYFTSDFYHMMLPPLMAVTVVLAIAAWPSTNSANIPIGFRRFMLSYMLVWSLCVAADWLQGPFVYALYAAYGFRTSEIAQLFVAGFGASMIFGCFVGAFADKFGRRSCCILYCVLYIISCISKHFNNYNVLMFGRMVGGIATSMLFSSFESWMVSEHMQRNAFSGELLSYMFGMMFTIMYAVAIVCALAGDAVAQAFTFGPVAKDSIFYTGGFIAPFDLSIVCLALGGMLISFLWEENYGEQAGAGDSGGMVSQIGDGFKFLAREPRALLLGILVSVFEASMFAFVFTWTPALESDEVPPPHGVIFALFMMSCMCGASVSTLSADHARPSVKLMITFIAGFMAFGMAARAVSNAESGLIMSMTAFLIFEFCVGVYFPSAGVLKSEIVPEKMRTTVYNIYRFPLNAIVVVLLLSNSDIAICFKLNAALLFIALVCIVRIHMSPTPAPSIIDGRQGADPGSYGTVVAKTHKIKVTN